MEEIAMLAEGLKKTFTLSKKQQKAERTTQKKKIAVNGLSFAVNKGEIYGLLGPNGAGKTTTLRMLATLIKPDEGDAKIFGNSIKTESDEVRNRIGFLTTELKPDEFFTPSYLFSFFGQLHNMTEEEIETRKKDMFARFGIDRFAETKISDLSTGMKQKVAIAISIVHDPDFVIFDEPTNGLDVLTAKTVTDFLRDLKAQGKTILLSTHIFSLVEKLCDRVGVIIDGKMVSEGTLEEVSNGKTLEDAFFDIYARVKGEEQ